MTIQDFLLEYDSFLYRYRHKRPFNHVSCGLNPIAYMPQIENWIKCGKTTEQAFDIMFKPAFDELDIIGGHLIRLKK